MPPLQPQTDDCTEESTPIGDKAERADPLERRFVRPGVEDAISQHEYQQPHDAPRTETEASDDGCRHSASESHGWHARCTHRIRPLAFGSPRGLSLAWPGWAAKSLLSSNVEAFRSGILGDDLDTSRRRNRVVRKVSNGHEP